MQYSFPDLEFLCMKVESPAMLRKFLRVYVQKARFTEGFVACVAQIINDCHEILLPYRYPI